MEEAAKSVAQVKRETEGLSKDEAKAAQKSREAAIERKEAWGTVGTALTAYGVAVTGITAAVLKTGISYNTLQQTSRAALTTLLGGAQAANAQMDKLDEFARSSPFSKQVFINAQRQLIGFGMEAEKVVPTLDAIQNAVAATGGSNQDIAELVTIIAQVGAAGKITATDLMQFGQRGVDAATLIGSQMGKTGAQIREEITKGTLGADEAIEALTAGMQEKFGGAADNVKNTFSGSVDRVRAAIRDLSSDWTAWLVDPNAATGGAAVTGLNKLADLMRGFRAMPDPFKNFVGGAFALSGAIALLAGGFITLAPRIVATQTAMATLGVTMPRTTAALSGMRGILMGPWGVALAAATVGLGVWAAKQGESRARVDELTASLDAQTGAITENTREIVAKQLHDQGLLEDAQRLGIAHGVLTDAILGDTEARRILNTAIEEAIRLGNENNSAMADSGGRYASNKKSAEDLQSALSGLGGEVQQAMADHEQLAAEVEGTASAQDSMALATEEAAAALEEQQAAADEAQAAMESFHKAILAVHDANLAASNSAIGYQQALAKATESIKDNGKNLDITTEKGRANQSALNGVAAAAIKVAEDNIKAGKATSEVSGEMAKARAEFIKTAEKMGASSDEAIRMADEFGLTTQTVHSLRASIEDIPALRRTEFVTNAAAIKQQVDSLQRAINNLKGKTVIIATQFSGPGARMVGPGMVGINADGGMWDKTRLGMVKQYASGGFFDGAIGAQQPQVRPYGGPRGLLWSEEGSGPWEAFISGHPAKRDRSMRIWLDVGRRLGAIAAHADGAVQQYARGTYTPGPSTGSASSLAGLQIAGTLDTPFGPAQIRGVVRSELDKVGRTISLSGGGY